MSPDSYAALFIALQKVNGGVGPSASGKPSVRITVTANDLAEACDAGLRIAAEALMECSITGVPEHVSVTLSL
ncbi:hypothetical protein ACIOG4_27850 [Streptomyces microflavus]|uniref:hypothetical protein n=1 Tax=Streptomyces microflavus TaxID=1919 RepID=UPI00382418DE